MFYGRYEHKVDAKGRIQIPVGLRKASEGMIHNAFFLVKGPDGCLALLLEKDFRDMETNEEVAARYSEAELVRVRREFFSNATYFELDNQSRLLLPKHMRDDAGITSDALLLGAGTYIEIWDEARYEKFKKDSNLNYDEVVRPFFALLGRKKSPAGTNG
jgi:MraZ protein